MQRSILHWLLGAMIWTSATVAHAQRSVSVGGLGANITFADLINNLTALFVGLSVMVCTVIFICGAYLMVYSRGEQDRLQQGKDYMIKSLLGLAVVMGSYGIYRTALFLLY